jgi:hypothetical protein
MWIVVTKRSSEPHKAHGPFQWRSDAHSFQAWLASERRYVVNVESFVVEVQTPVGAAAAEPAPE